MKSVRIKYMITVIACYAFILIGSYVRLRIHARATQTYHMQPLYTFDFFCSVLAAILLLCLFRISVNCPAAFGLTVDLCCIAVFMVTFFIHPFPAFENYVLLFPISVFLCLLSHGRAFLINRHLTK